MKKCQLVIMCVMMVLSLCCVPVYCGVPSVDTVRIGLEKNYNKKASIGVASTKFKVSVGAGKNYTMDMGASVVKPISKQYYDVGLTLESYSTAVEKMQKYIGSNCIPVLKDDGWTIYLTSNTKADTRNMKLIKTGGNAVVFSVNGVNKYIVDGDESARVSTDNDIVDLEKGRYRGYVAFYCSGQTLTAINILSPEQYLYGVIASEMPSSWNMEALKAQAVAARTYLYATIGKHGVYDLCDNVNCQNYNGVNGETQNSTKAVNDTKGKCIYYDGKLISTPYFSSSGGVTMNSEDVWLSQAGYLRSVSDTYEVGGRVWTRNFTNDSLTKVASANGYGIGTVKNVTVEYHTYGPVKSLTLIGDKGSKTIEKDAVRTMFSSSSEGSLLSVNFKLIKNDDGSYTFDGKGYGHGVGMSQYGAKGMAEQGYTYDAILKHYYTGVTIE